MTLNGIDISSYQAGLNPAAMRGTDFIIIKVSQGTGYINPTWRRQADQTLQSGRLLGLYHYISGGNPQAEANYFVNQIRPYIGRALLALDWESGQNGAWGNQGYLKAVANEVIRLTGVRPLLYGSATVYGLLSNVSRATNCGLWVAQYATTQPTYGWQAHPWNEGVYGCAIRQYADNAHVPGYGAGLDQDIFYGDRNSWLKYQGKTSGEEPEVVTEQDKKDIAEHVWDFIQNGTKMRDRVQGIDGAANSANEKTQKLAATLLRTDDAGTKSGNKTDIYTHVVWSGYFLHQIIDKLDNMEKEIQALKTGTTQAPAASVPQNVSGTFQVKEVNDDKPAANA